MPIEYDGRTQTYAEWARETGLPISTIRDRLRRHGWSPEEALTLPLGKHVRTIEFEGKEQSVSEWAKEKGLTVATIRGRLGLKWSVTDTLTVPTNGKRPDKPPSSKGLLIEFDGRTQTLVEWAKEMGLTAGTIRGRLKLGWPTFDVLNAPAPQRNPHGMGTRRKNMRDYTPPHKRLDFRPKPADSRCELCGEECVQLQGDHDKITGRFRGWLCFHCNTGLGKLGDSIDGLRRALNYLERTTLIS